MKLPHSERALIEREKLMTYLLNLNTAHKRGGAKARLLAQFGYHENNWQQLEMDIRQFHCNAEVDLIRETMYGMRYEIRAALQSPNGRELFVRTIWQIDEGNEFPRLLTLIPD